MPRAALERKVRIYYGLLPLFALAMIVTVTTDHLGVLWIALEATTLTTTPLVALYKKDGAIEAAGSTFCSARSASASACSGC